jgi:hypothetical protein
MEGKNLALFMERRGREIEAGAGMYWHSNEGRMMLSLPYHRVLEDRGEEVDAMLRSSRALGARYPSLNNPGAHSGLYMARQKDYAIATLSTRFRSKVRKALETCEVRLCDPEQLRREGLAMNLQTMERQGRMDSEFGTEAGWRRLVEAAERTEQIQLWGSHVNGELGAYVITYEADGWLHLMHQNSRADLLAVGPNHAITYQLTHEFLQRPETEGVSYGWFGLSQSDGLHEFKRRMGFSLEQRNMVCRFHPLASPMLTSALAAGAIRVARQWRPEDQRFERLERIVEAGRVSAGKQAPPVQVEEESEAA